MVTFGLNYDVRPGAEARFEQVVNEVLGLLGSVAGHRETRLYRDVHRPSGYLIYSEWETRDGFTGFTHSPTFQRVLTMGQDLLLGPPVHHTYRQVDDGPGPV